MTYVQQDAASIVIEIILWIQKKFTPWICYLLLLVLTSSFYHTSPYTIKKALLDSRHQSMIMHANKGLLEGIYR